MSGAQAAAERHSLRILAANHLTEGCRQLREWGLAGHCLGNGRLRARLDHTQRVRTLTPR